MAGDHDLDEEVTGGSAAGADLAVLPDEPYRFTAVDGPTPVAYDGEVGEALSEASFTVRYRALPVFRPLP